MSPEENYRQRMKQSHEDYDKEVDRIFRKYYQRIDEIDAYYTPRIRVCNMVLWTIGAVLASVVTFILCTLL